MSIPEQPQEDWAVGIGPPGQIEAHCRHCDGGGRLIVISDSREKLIKAVVTHMLSEHDGGSGLLVEARAADQDGDFQTGPAHWRCDLCGAIAEPPFWEYVTPSAQATPATPAMTFEDETWLVCDACQPHVTTRNMVKLAGRAINMTSMNSGVDRQSARDQILPILQSFLSHFDPKRTKRVG